MKNEAGMGAKLVRDAAILLVITLFSGLILGFVFQITKEPIALAEEKAAKKAYSEVFPSALEFELTEELPLDSLSGDSAWLEAGYEGVSVENVLRALDKDGTLLGYVLTVTSHEGYERQDQYGGRHGNGGYFCHHSGLRSGRRYLQIYPAAL